MWLYSSFLSARRKGNEEGLIYRKMFLVKQRLQDVVILCRAMGYGFLILWEVSLRMFLSTLLYICVCS